MRFIKDKNKIYFDNAKMGPIYKELHDWKISYEKELYEKKSNLREGYQVFSYTEDALNEYRNKSDVIFSLQVIKHVPNPKQFLKAILELLKPGGKLIIQEALLILLDLIRFLFTLPPFIRLKVKFVFFILRFAFNWSFGLPNLKNSPS